MPVKIFDDGLKVFATALILSTGIGVDLKTAIIVCGFVTVTYTLLGGLWALVVTDYIQFLMKIAAMLLLLPLAIWHVGGPSHALKGLPLKGMFLVNFSHCERAWLSVTSHGTPA